MALTWLAQSHAPTRALRLRGKHTVVPTIIFDTSGINCLEDSGAASESIMRGLQCGFDVVLTGASVEEIIATGTAERREALLRRCDRLLQSAQCLWPPNEIVRLLIAAHLANPSTFDWTRVDVRARAYEAAVPRRDFTDAVCAEQRRQHFQVESNFRKYWTRLRPKLDAILAKDPSKRPDTYHDAVSIAVRDKGVLWGLGQGLYKYAAKREPTEAEIKSFMSICPPFRAACYGLVMAWYNWSLRPQDDQTATAGRNDLMTAAYLPYSERFISDDWAHRKDLREVAIEAKVACEILSFKEFEQGFALHGPRPPGSGTQPRLTRK